MTFLVESLVLFGLAAVLGKGAFMVRLPPLLGMIMAGMVFSLWGPVVGAEPGLQEISGDLRFAILALVLLRAGLNISTTELRDAGSLALTVGTLPLAAEAVFVGAAGYWILGLPGPACVVLGLVVAPISPAIVIPGLLELHPASEGRSRRVVTALLVGAPIDNILAVVGLGVAVDLALAGDVAWMEYMLWLPYRVGFGVILGLLVGAVYTAVASRVLWRGEGDHSRLISLSLWFTGWCVLELGQWFEISFVLALIALGIVLRARKEGFARDLSQGMARLWAWGQYILFSLIGAAVEFAQLAEVGLWAVAIIVFGQIGRFAGAHIATKGMKLTTRERTACAMAYMPKATIQAAFGALALDRGLESGSLILTFAVLAIVLTAPLGAVTLMEGTRRLLGIPAAQGGGDSDSVRGLRQ